jgi:hypothetical protein
MNNPMNLIDPDGMYVSSNDTYNQMQLDDQHKMQIDKNKKAEADNNSFRFYENLGPGDPPKPREPGDPSKSGMCLNSTDKRGNSILIAPTLNEVTVKAYPHGMMDPAYSPVAGPDVVGAQVSFTMEGGASSTTYTIGFLFKTDFSEAAGFTSVSIGVGAHTPGPSIGASILGGYESRPGLSLSSIGGGGVSYSGNYALFNAGYGYSTDKLNSVNAAKKTFNIGSIGITSPGIGVRAEYSKTYIKSTKSN